MVVAERGRAEGRRREEFQSLRETPGDDVHYLDCGDDFAGVFICQKLSKAFLSTCAVFYMPIIPP